MLNHIHNPVNITVTIAKEEVNPVNLLLTQEYGEHHHFEIILDYDMYGDGFMSNPLKHIELIGRFVFIQFKHGEAIAKSYLFKGVITNVKQTAKEGKKGYLIISGSSPTIMLEKGKRMDIYSDKTLYKITKQIAERAYSDYLNFVSDPVYQNKVDFLMQYNESDWDFLKRLAFLYRENFFYDGYELKFGTFQDSTTIDLTYDREIIDLEFCSKMLATNFERYQYVSETDSYIEREVPKKIENSNDYLDKVEEMSYISMNVSDHSKTYMDAPIYGTSEISQILKQEKSRNAAQTLTIKGKSKTYQTSIGQIINIAIPDILSKTSNIGTYRIIKSRHIIDEKNRYTCEFEAISASLDTTPIQEPKELAADSVMGTVKSNQDPLNQGRVQVSFDFASSGSYAWLRVLTPNAGLADDKSKNRGMVFVPEVGDQVMLGFEYGDPNRPYVMGSLFHGKSGQGGGANNAEKSIITKSGVQIVFNDNSGSLHIQDPSGNTWDMDGKGNINVNAPNDITIKGKNITFSAIQDIQVAAGNNMQTDVMNRISTNTNKITQKITGSYNVQSFKTNISTTEQMTFESKEMYIAGSESLFLHSNETLTANSMSHLYIKGTEGTNMTNEADEYTVAEQVLDAGCIVFFKLQDSKRVPNFSFDWMRLGKDGDNIKFHEICGYYETTTTTIDKTIFEEDIFIKDISKFRQLEKEYNNPLIGSKPLLIPKGISGQPKIERNNKVKVGEEVLNDDFDRYYTPWLKLYPSTIIQDGIASTADLKLYLKTKEKREKDIVFEYNTDYFTVTPPSLPADNQKNKEHNVSITCNKEFAKIEVIEAYLKISNEEKKLAGRIFVLPNDAANRYKIKIRPVMVLLKEGDKRYIKDEINLDDIETWIKERITPLFINAEVLALDTFNLTKAYNNGIFDSYFVQNNSMAHSRDKEILSKSGSNDLLNFCGRVYYDFKNNEAKKIALENENERRKKEGKDILLEDNFTDYESPFENTATMFFVNILASDQTQDVPLSTTNFPLVAGIANSPGSIFMIFKDGITQRTICHEFLHTLGLSHTFENDSKHVFKQSQTDNLMDYYNKGEFSYKWQWDKIDDVADYGQNVLKTEDI